MNSKINIVSEPNFFHLLNRMRYFLPTPSKFTYCYIQQVICKIAIVFIRLIFYVRNNSPDIFKEIVESIRRKMERNWG